MKCPHCKFESNGVVDSRDAEEGRAIRRRRKCDGCDGRFTTYERIEERPLMVIKKGDRRQVFDPNKLTTGILRACEKRPVSLKTIQALVQGIEQEAQSKSDGEVGAQKLGEMVMGKLKDLDEVAYVRFASVYRSFKDAAEFAKEIEAMKTSVI